ncbi:response regulator [Cohnella sp.]|uniref:response regulator transcription factor n=1 Tax=Cohnella sp. TaxID=1883426 RepID=UPI003565611D
MISILLVDDEPIVRLALRELTDWGQLGCEIAAEAANGREALEIVRSNRIGIVIIDLTMPIMNGLEFLKQLKHSDDLSKPRVIVLSAYSNYEYVREAFLHGAVDYIIKDDLEEAAVTAVVSKAIEAIGETTRAHERSLREEERLYVQGKEAATRQALNPITPESGVEMPSPRVAQWLAGTLQSTQLIICLKIDRSYGLGERTLDEERERFLRRSILQVMESQDRECYLIPLQSGDWAILLLFSHEDRVQLVRHQASDLLNRLTSQLKHYMNLSVSVGVSEPCVGHNFWNERYQQANRLASLRYATGLGRIHFPENLPMPSKSPRTDTSAGLFTNLLYKLEKGNLSWRSDWTEICKLLEHEVLFSQESVRRAFRSLLWELQALLHAYNRDWSQVTESAMEPFQRLEECETLSDTLRWMDKIVNDCANLVDPARRVEEAVPRMIEAACKYIDRNFSEPLSLQLLSEMAGVSESYFSKQFAKESGCNFVDYVAKVRVEMAKKWMGSGMKLYEIAERVGYPNQAHFSKVFRKVAGETPQEYRERIRLR